MDVDGVDDNDRPSPSLLVLTAEDVSTDAYKFITSDDNNIMPASSEIGSPVYAFGYPMGVEGPTMTSGILSATTKGIKYMDAPTGKEPSEASPPVRTHQFCIHRRRHGGRHEWQSPRGQ